MDRRDVLGEPLRRSKPDTRMGNKESPDSVKSRFTIGLANDLRR